MPVPLSTTIYRTMTCLCVAVALAACSNFPYQVSSPKELRKQLQQEQIDSDGPKAKIVSLCYSGTFNSQDELLEEARYVCPDGTVEFREEDLFRNGCALTQATRASFICTPNPEPVVE